MLSVLQQPGTISLILVPNRSQGHIVGESFNENLYILSKLAEPQENLRHSPFDWT